MKYLLQFSGGRDSLALLKYWEPYKDETLVIWVDAGAAIPELEKIIYNAVSGWRFVRVKSDSANWIESNGYPFDVVPIWNNGIGKAISGRESEISISSSLDCCFNNIMVPLHETARKVGATCIVRGQRTVEEKKSPIRDGSVVDGILYRFPLQEWSDEDTNQYLSDNGIELPEWYNEGTKGIDCWYCTGYASESKGIHNYLKNNHPEKYAEIRRRFKLIKKVVLEEISHV